jgi:hypothetical protein
MKATMSSNGFSRAAQCGNHAPALAAEGRSFGENLPSGAEQAAEKLRRDGERAEFGGCKTINQPSRIGS